MINWIVSKKKLSNDHYDVCFGKQNTLATAKIDWIVALFRINVVGVQVPYRPNPQLITKMPENAGNKYINPTCIPQPNNSKQSVTIQDNNNRQAESSRKRSQRRKKQLKWNGKNLLKRKRRENDEERGTERE